MFRRPPPSQPAPTDSLETANPDACLRKVMRDAAATIVLQQVENRKILAPRTVDTMPCGVGLYDNVFAKASVIPKLEALGVLYPVLTSQIAAGFITNAAIPPPTSDEDPLPSPLVCVLKSSDPASISICNQSSVGCEIVRCYLFASPITSAFPDFTKATAAALVVNLSYLDVTQATIIQVSHGSPLEQRALAKAAASRAELLVTVVKDALLLMAKLNAN